MATMEVDETSTEEVPAGNLLELAKNPTALKEAHEQMATLDVLVCGQCHEAYYFLEEFKDHKEKKNCTGKSPVRDSNKIKAQVWAFLLWKCASAREGLESVDNNWKLYKQWCRMPEAQRTIWITAGSDGQALSKFSHAKVEEIEPAPSGEERAAKSSASAKIKESIRGAQERVPAAAPWREPQEFVVEKILAKRFNPRRKQYEYLLKWEGYPHEQNTWDPVENMETCKHLLEAFEKQLARQKKLKALRAQQQTQNAVQVKQTSTSLPQVVKQMVKKNDTPTLTPTGRLRRSSKARALEKMKDWCGYANKHQRHSSDPDEPREMKTAMNGQPSPKAAVDPELLKSLGLRGKGMPNIKEVVGVCIMSKSSGIMKIDSPGKIGPGLNLDQEFIKKQIMAAKQIKKTHGPAGQQVTEKTIITPSGQKIIQRTIQRPLPASANADGKTPVTILNKELAQGAGDSLLRRGGAGRGRGRGSFSLSPAVRPKEKTVSFDFDKWSTSLESSDGVEDPFPKNLGPIPPASPHRPLTLCPLTGKRLARAENEPTPPPTPSPLPTPPPETHAQGTMLMTWPGGTNGIVVQGDAAQHSLPVLTYDDVTEMMVEPSAVKQPLEEAAGGEDGGEVGLHDFDKWSTSSESSDGVEDPFPKNLGPIPPASPDRPLTLCPLTGKRLARAENEPTPPPTPSPPPTPPPETHAQGTMLMTWPGGTNGIVVQGDAAQHSLPVLTYDDGTEMMVEPSAVKQPLEEAAGGEDGGEVGLQLHAGHRPIMIWGEDGVLYQVVGENEPGQILLVAAESVEGAAEGAGDGDGEGVMYVTSEDEQTPLVATQAAGEGAGEGDADARRVMYVTRGEDGPTPLPTPFPPPTPPPETHAQGTMLMTWPGGTNGIVVQGDAAQHSLPVLTYDDGTEMMVEPSAVKQPLEEAAGGEDGGEVGLQLHAGHRPIMIWGEDGVLYQVVGENEPGQILLVAAESVEGAAEGAGDGDGEGVMYVTSEDEQTPLVATQAAGEGAGEGDADARRVMYVTRGEDGQNVLTIDPGQLAALLPGGEAGGLQEVEGGEEAMQDIAQFVQAEQPSPVVTQCILLLLSSDGSFTMSELNKEQYESITNASTDRSSSIQNPTTAFDGQALYY